MDGWIDGRANGWMNECMDEWIYGYRDRRMDGWIVEQMVRQTNGGTDGQTGRQSGS